MSSPKKKIHGFRDKVQVHSTKAGSQFVRPSDVILSKEAKEDSRLIRKVFGEATKNGTPQVSAARAKSKSGE